ncbi:MAG: ArsR family transcriptional regulator [Proteobacteria bacterium]|nr:ArsR family transcriptional regulator [Pseudomonadota bacterium]MBS0268692.1 ArsR family transcriptional regulator [Pseudomonadota bacterium]
MLASKHAIFECLAHVAEALAHPNRLELLEHLGQGKRPVEDLTAVTGMTFANTSRHLQILRRARLVETERQGKRIFYSLASQAEVVTLLKALGSVGESNCAEIRQIMSDYFVTRDALSPVSREDLVARLRDGEVTLIDVRPEHEFDLGHVPGALNVPFNELEKGLAQLPRDQEIVAYCRGPYCVLSFDAVALLRERGFRARRLVDGMPEWQASGLPVEVSVF